MRKEIFSYLEDGDLYLKELELEDAAKIISCMDSDDAADILEEMDDIDRKRLVNMLDAESGRDVQLILSYEEEEIGSRMTNKNSYSS